ncbi:sensor domain-containing protein [Leeia oryzae]|uniref:sensor domain-containing protein n=1 Tax=Leeia oryzae TaxID=356662 RepID=UPI00036DD749|nr:EAL domain-containing protein [Leeia oryzae]
MSPILSPACINSIFDAAFFVDAETLQVHEANEMACALTGMRKEQLLGSSVQQWFPSPEDALFWSGMDGEHAGDVLLDSETLLQNIVGHQILIRRRITRLDDVQLLVVFKDISDHTAQQRKLTREVAELKSTLEACSDAVVVVDVTGRIRNYNRAFDALWLQHHALLGKDILNQPVDLVMGPQLAEPADFMLVNYLNLGASQLPQQVIIKTQQGLYLEQTITPQFVQHQLIGYVVYFRDISRLIAGEQDRTLAASVFECNLDAIIVLDQALNILHINPKAEQLQSRLNEYGASSLPDLLKLADTETRQNILDGLEISGEWRGEVLFNVNTDIQHPFDVYMTRLKHHSNTSAAVVAFIKDNSESKAAKDRLEELTQHDSLTGLPNRTLFQDILSSLIASPYPGNSFAVVCLDLDHFKHINDSLGHAFGDKVLREVSKRLVACLRPVDIAARQGGDEFILLLKDVDEVAAERVVKRIIDYLTIPYDIDQQAFSLTASLGIALFPENGLTADDLIKNADSAMYHVKGRGRSGARFYQQQMNTGLLSRMKLDHAMRAALKQNLFYLDYQPQINTDCHTLGSVEALIRWKDPMTGIVPPGKFIPLAEETGFIMQIGSWVLDEACRQAAVWHKANMNIVVAVNVSALQFQQPNFVDEVAEALLRHQLPAHLLELELTETSLVREVEDTIRRLKALAELGIKLAIDDFGTGYSNLAYLKQFPIHSLKIDRSFIKGIPGNHVDEGLIHAMINMATALKLKVLAEGVETRAQRDFLVSTGCNNFQGYLFARPTSPDEISRLYHHFSETKDKKVTD